MSDCTYTFTDASGQERTITGMASMKAFLVDGGLDLFYPSGRFPWLSIEPAASSLAADERGPSGDGTTAAERDLRTKAHDDEQAGDVMLYNGRFVSLDDAVAAARANMTPEQWKMPFQFNNVLDIAPRDWGRMVEAMAEGDASNPAQEIDTSGESVDQAVMSGAAPDAGASKLTQADAANEAGGNPVSNSLNKPHTIDRKQVLTPSGSISAGARNSRADSSIWYHQGDIKMLAMTASVKIDGQLSKGADEAKRIVKAVSTAQKAGWALRNYRAGTLGTVWALEKGDQFLTKAGLENIDAEQVQDPQIPNYGPGWDNMVRGQKDLAKALFSWLSTLPAEQRENQATVSRKMADVLGGWAYIERDKLGVHVRYKPTEKPGGKRVSGAQWTHTIPASSDWSGALQKIAEMADGSFDAKDATPAQDAAADGVSDQPASTTPATDAHNTLMDAVREGKATPEQFKAGFEAVVAGKAAIMAELDAKTKVQLLREGGPYVQMRYASEKKADVVGAIYRQMLGEYSLGESVTYGMGKDSYQNAVRLLVEATDADKLAGYVQERNAALGEAKARREAKAAAIENPKTLDDFRNAVGAKMREGMSNKEAFLSLTPEQRIQYDTLAAESTKEARESRKRSMTARVSAAGQTTGGQIIATQHTRDGYDLFVVQLADRLSKEDYGTMLSSAKRLGGWYSSFRGNGATPGFQFKDRAGAEAFLKLAGGDATAATEQVEQRRDAFEDDRSQTAVERLNAMADKLEAQAEEIEGRDRKTNTARRARFASAALAEAAADQAKAKTMRNIAQAIEGGKAKFLDGVRTKSQVDMLTGIVETAKAHELRAKYPSYADQEKRKGEPPTAETADFAEFPNYTAFRSDLATLGRQMLEVEGAKKLGQRLMSVADDVTDAYLEFAKGNLFKVSQFGRGDSMADFSNKDDAERALKRSELTGKAIVLQVKRGQNRVILSPSESIGRGVWAGDGDKRITLTADFGNELVEAIGRRGNKPNRLTVPWQFQTAYDRRKALTRIGIETPSEYRSALREFIGLKEQATQNRVRELELQMVGRKSDGLDFFPTSSAVADQMVEAADLSPDMAVLEPSAGMGHLADRIRAAGAEPDVVEISPDRRELLEEKGYHLVEANDFTAMEPRKFFTYGDVYRAPDGTEGIMRGAGSMGSQRMRLDDEDGNRLGFYDRSELTGVRHRGSWSGYDRIIMNPPFSKRQDAEHVQHAFDLLKPGGRIVAIMGEGVFFGQDKRAQEFRDWLDSVGGTSEKLPEGSFTDPSLPVTTGVNARMVVIDKPVDAPAFSRKADNASHANNSDAGQADGSEDTIRAIEAIERKLGGPYSASSVIQGWTNRRILGVTPIAETLGAKIVGYKIGDQAHQAGLDPQHLGKSNGLHYKGYTFLNADTDRPHLAVLGHETAHEMRRKRPDLYWKLVDSIAPYVKASEYESKFVNSPVAIDLAGRDEAQQEEFIGEVLSDGFMDREFWRALGDNNPGLLDEVWQFVSQILSKVFSKYGTGYTRQTQEYLTDYSRVMQIAGEVMAEYGMKPAAPATFSRGMANAGMPTFEIEATIANIAANWANAPEVVVAANMQDAKVPQEVRDYDTEQRSLGAQGEPEGFWFDDKVYLVASALHQPADVVRVLLHESLGHHGLNGVFGDRLNTILRQVAAQRRAEVQVKADEYGLDMDDEDQLLQAAEEVLAVMAQTNPKLGFVKRAIGAIRSWLRKHIPMLADMELTDAEIIRNYIMPARAYVQRGAQAGRDMAAGRAIFSRSQDQTQTEAFKRWFAGSKVVDSQGMPMVVYHGSGTDFNEFDSGRLGENTGYEDAMAGFHFADNKADADHYASMAARKETGDEQASGVVRKFYLNLQNPLIIGMDESDGNAGDMTQEFLDDKNTAKEYAEENGHDGIIYLYGTNVDSSYTAIAFRPEQIKSATENNGDFDPANPDIRFSRAMSPLSSQPSAWEAPADTYFDRRVIYALQDKHIDTKRVQAAITKTAGEIEDEINTYQREELYHGRAAKRAQDFLTQELNPMVEQLAKDGIELADFEEYLHARHAPEANRVLAERNPNQDMIDAGLEAATLEIEKIEIELAATTDPAEIKLLSRRMREAQADLSKWSSVQAYRGTEEDRLRLSGMSDDQARAIMDALTPELQAKLDASAAKFDAIVDQNRQLMVDYDLEDQETIDGWSQLFQHYVPLMREDEGNGIQQGMGTGQGFSIKGREVKSRTGSTRKVVDIVANVAMQRERTITRGEKNRVSQALMGLAALNPNPDFWKLGAPDRKRQYDPATNTVKVVTDPQYKNRENVVVAKVRNNKGNVTEVALTFNERDPRAVRMAAAIKNLEDGQLNWALSNVAKVTRYFASMNTQYNIIWGAVNMLRDLQAAAINLAGTPLSGSKARIVKDAFVAIKNIYGGARVERKGRESRTDWGSLWQEFQEVGAMTGFRDHFRDSQDRARAIERTMNPEKWMESAFGKFVTAGGLLKAPMAWIQDGGGWVLDWISDVNLAIENGVRLATYKEGLAKGMSQEKAASLAKNITVNFNRRGTRGAQIGAGWAFFNAGMQGTARIGQLMTTMEDGKLKTLRLSPLGKKVVTGGLMLGTAQAVVLAASGFGDDEPPEFVREKNLIIPTGWTGIASDKGYVTIPMPLGLHVIPGLGRHMTEFAMSGGKDPAGRVISIMTMLLDAFNPIGSSATIGQTLAPTVFDPMLALSENKDFTGRPIAIENRDKNIPGHKLARDTASSIGKLISEAINTLTGGNDYVSGHKSPTPDQIDYLIGQVFGGVGREALKINQAVTSAITGEDLPLYKIPLVGRFVGDSNGSTGQSAIYRSNVDRLDRVEKEIEGLRKDGRIQESNALRQRSNPYLLAQANAAESQVRRLRSMKRDMVEKGASKESVKEVERKITDAMRRLNQASEAGAR